jgi:hypothetical protein
MCVIYSLILPIYRMKTAQLFILLVLLAVGVVPASGGPLAYAARQVAIDGGLPMPII